MSVATAIEGMQMVAAVKPAWAHCFDAGNAMIAAGDFRKAIQAFSDALSSCTDANSRAVVCSARALALSYAGYNAEAIVDLSFAIKMNANYADAYYLRGICQKQLSNFEKAIEDFGMAIGLGKMDAETFANRADAYVKLGLIEFAILDLAEASKIDPGKATELEKLMTRVPTIREVLSNFIAGDPVAALYACSNAVQINPEHTVVFYIAACAYNQLGDFMEARTTFQHCRQLACKQPGRAAREIARTCSREEERMPISAPPSSLSHAA
jgi:tetratricopeptide (TPR) repeat protein